MPRLRALFGASLICLSLGACEPAPRSLMTGFAGAGAVALDQLDRHYDALARTGARWVRVYSSWEQIEPPVCSDSVRPPCRSAGEPAWRWDAAHTKVDLAQHHGLKVLWLIAYSNRKYSSDSSRFAGDNRDRHPPSLEGMRRFCRRTARELLPRGVRDFEVWNEPNLSSFLRRPGNAPVTASTYFPLLDTCYRALHDVAADLDRDSGASTNYARELNVVSGAVLRWRCDQAAQPRCDRDGGHRNPIAWTREMYEYLHAHHPPGTPPPWDSYGLHPYNNNLSSPLERVPENTLRVGARKVHDVLAWHGHGHMKIWVTEYGWFTKPRAALERAVTYEVQARHHRQALAWWYERPFAGPFFVYALRDVVPDGHALARERSSNMGVMEYDFDPKPAYGRIRDLIGAQ